MPILIVTNDICRSICPNPGYGQDQAYSVASQVDSSGPPAEASALYSSGASIDLDGSTSNQQLDALISQMRPEQWLNPSAFSWEDWDFMMPERVDGRQTTCARDL